MADTVDGGGEFEAQYESFLHKNTMGGNLQTTIAK